MKKRVYEYFNVADIVTFNIQLLNWSTRFSNFCLMDSNHQSDKLGSIQKMVAAGSVVHLQCNAGNAFAELDAFIAQNNDWVFGHLGYNLKNEIETLESKLLDPIGFPDLYFFVPEIVLEISDSRIQIGSVNKSPQEVFEEIQTESTVLPAAAREEILPMPRMTKGDYLATVKSIQQNLLQGACYELNYCQEFFSSNTFIHPPAVFDALNQDLQQPFSVYYQWNYCYAMSASPERFIAYKEDYLWSQPMKGTAKRIHDDAAADAAQRQQLMTDPKERAENIMVVDLVRNDLSKVCVAGTVTVPELCKVMSFPKVHQMISTVKGKPIADIGLGAIMKACFPMGSMTGAPKKKVMELIEKYECSNRGLFSGSIGYIKPNGDFDFNVMIRSVFYNQNTAYLSFHTGSGITYYAQPEREYEECLLKAAAIKKVLTEVSTLK